MRPRGEAARSALGTGGGQGRRRAGPDGTWAGAAAEDRRLSATSPPNQGRRDALWLARGQKSGMDFQTEGQLWGKGDMGAQRWSRPPRTGGHVSFLLLFFFKFLFYTEHISNLSVILARAAGDRLIFSGSFHVECIHCRNELRPRVSEQPRCFVFGHQFPGAGRSPGDLAKSCEFGPIGPEVCRPRSSA